MLSEMNVVCKKRSSVVLTRSCSQRHQPRESRDGKEEVVEVET